MIHDHDPPFPESLLAGLHDHDIDEFMRLFLKTRYRGLITPLNQPVIGFANLEEYVDALISALKESPDQVRQRFFAPRNIQMAHQAFRARNGARKWLFEAMAILPFFEGIGPGSLIVDIGAGDNSFLSKLKKLLNRKDLAFLGMDRARVEDLADDEVDFCLQPGDYHTGLDREKADAVILKAAAHHMEDLGAMLKEIRRILKPGGLLILIEESSDRVAPTEIEPISEMMDMELNRAFYSMALKKRLTSMKILDYYGVRIYRGWDDMPLPLHIHDINGWSHIICEQGFSFKSKVNMGFARPEYVSCLQRCNLALLFSPVI